MVELFAERWVVFSHWLCRKDLHLRCFADFSRCTLMLILMCLYYQYHHLFFLLGAPLSIWEGVFYRNDWRISVAGYFILWMIQCHFIVSAITLKTYPWQPFLRSNFVFLAALLLLFYLYDFTLRMASSKWEPNLQILWRKKKSYLPSTLS